MHASSRHVHTQQISIIGHVYCKQDLLDGKASANFC